MQLGERAAELVEPARDPVVLVGQRCNLVDPTCESLDRLVRGQVALLVDKRLELSPDVAERLVELIEAVARSAVVANLGPELVDAARDAAMASSRP